MAAIIIPQIHRKGQAVDSCLVVLTLVQRPARRRRRQLIIIIPKCRQILVDAPIASLRK